MTPTRIVSDPEHGAFSVSFKNIEPGEHTVFLPPGYYNRALTFIGPTNFEEGRAYLNLFCKSPNAAAPIEAGLQLVNRFDNNFEGGRWQEHTVDIEVSGQDRELTLQCGVASGNSVCVYLVKLFGA